jgi:hypothetical protein
MFGERLDGPGQQAPQAQGVITADGPRPPLTFHIPGEHTQKITEGEEGVTDTGKDITITPGHDEVFMGRLCLASKGIQKARLALSCLTGDKDKASLTG